MSRLYYHHPSDSQFSLDFVNSDDSESLSRVVGYDGHVEVKVTKHTEGNTFYAIYTKEAGGDPLNNIFVNKRFDDRNNDIIISRLLVICQRISDENKEEEGKPIIKYKESEIEEIPRVLDRVDWSGTATRVAGEIASQLIMKHPFPNANHRTAISIAQVYLQQIDTSFSMPETVTDDYGWKDWVNEYIMKSKTLLTVRKHNDLLSHAQEFGVTELERKEGIIIDLTEYELGLNRKAWEKYGERHEDHWVEFMREAVERAGKKELKQKEALSKPQFADRMADG